MKTIYKIIFGLSLLIMIAAIIATATYGLKLGVDFRGGSVLEVLFTSERPSVTDIQGLLKKEAGIEVSASLAGEDKILIRTIELDETLHQKLLTVIKNQYPSSGVEELSFNSIGPVIGQELKSKSITAIVIVLIAIIIYIALVFRKLSRTLSPWAMGFSAVVALAHDVVIPVGVFSILGHFYGVEIEAVFVAAALTILGYSVSDSVVVFDRVRENIIRGKGRQDFGEVVHQSIMQTLTRSINTTLTTLLSLVAIYLFGGETVRFFALALIIGIFLGAYSSIFVASPLLVWWTNRGHRS